MPVASSGIIFDKRNDCDVLNFFFSPQKNADLTPNWVCQITSNHIQELP